MNELEKIMWQIVNENREKISNALVMQIAEEIAEPMIEIIAQEMNLHYESVEVHLSTVLRNFEKKLKADR